MIRTVDEMWGTTRKGESKTGPRCFARGVGGRDLSFIERRRQWEDETWWGISGIHLRPVNLAVSCGYM